MYTAAVKTRKKKKSVGAANSVSKSRDKSSVKSKINRTGSMQMKMSKKVKHNSSLTKYSIDITNLNSGNPDLQNSVVQRAIATLSVNGGRATRYSAKPKTRKPYHAERQAWRAAKVKLESIFIVKRKTTGATATVQIDVDTPYCDGSTKNPGCEAWLNQVIPSQIVKILRNSKRESPCQIDVTVNAPGAIPLTFQAVK